MKKPSTNIIEDIRKLIAQNQLKDAIELLKALLKNSPQLNEVILQASRFRAIRQQIRTATVNFEDGSVEENKICLLYTSPSPRDLSTSRMPSSA